jgi:hypothetical protein
MKRFVLSLLFVFVFSGCATDSRIKPLLNSMSSANQAIGAFGPPSSVSQMPDGASLYVWQSAWSYTGGGYPVYQPNTQYHSGSVYAGGRYAGTYSGVTTGGTWTQTPTYEVNMQCSLRMIVEPSGGIRTWTYQGNDCDRLVVNADAVPVGIPPLGSTGDWGKVSACLEEHTTKLAETSQDVDFIKSEAKAACQRITGVEADSLSANYARKALEAKQTKGN